MRAIFLIAAALLAWPASAEVFIDLGLTAADVSSRFVGRAMTVDRSELGAHAGLGFRRRFERSDIGVRLELDDLGSDTLFAVRAFDYRRLRSERLAFTAFIGAARLDRPTPAFGFYLGGGAQLRNAFGDWNLNLELRLAEKVARDSLLPTDPAPERSPDNFHDVIGFSVYLSRGF